MIELFSTGHGASLNVRKVLLALHELALPFELRPVHIERGEQFTPEFLRISANNRAPAIVDHAPADGGAQFAVFESGAIMEYLADKAGRLLPPTTLPRQRADVIQWCYWQVGGFGPNIGQFIHFAVYAPEKLPYPIQRFTNEISRLLAVADRRLGGSPWLGGADYSIADIISFASTHEFRRLPIDGGAFPHFLAWHDRIRARPAYTQAFGAAAPGEETVGGSQYVTPEAWNILFSQSAATIRAAHA